MTMQKKIKKILLQHLKKRYKMNIEHKIEKMANEAIAFHKASGSSLSDSVRDIMCKYALNQHETARVCERVNHLKFGSEFAMDKTATFEIARITDVLRPEVETEEDVYTFGKVASDNSKRDINVKAKIDREVELNEMKKLAEFASERIPQLNYERDGLMDSIKNELIALIKLGESKESLYELVTSITNDRTPLSKEAFDFFLSSLSNEGYDTPMAKNASDSNAFSKPREYPSLRKNISLYLAKTAEQAKNELGYEYCMNKLASVESEEYMEFLDEKVRGKSLVSEAVAYSLSKTGGVLSAFNAWNTATASGGTGPTRLSRAASRIYNAGRSSANLAGRVLIGGALLGGAMKGISALQESSYDVKRKKMKNALRESYPELLGNIPDKTYSNIFDGITQLQPVLMKAPYPLAEMIRHQAEYGTIDPKMTMDLLGSWGKTRTAPSSLVSPFTGNGSLDIF